LPKALLRVPPIDVVRIIAGFTIPRASRVRHPFASSAKPPWPQQCADNVVRLRRAWNAIPGASSGKHPQRTARILVRLVGLIDHRGTFMGIDAKRSAIKDQQYMCPLARRLRQIGETTS
jgi:hypothetical protein